ncbi:hypothetical protein T3H97_06465 [Paenibacillus sp. LX16]|nr:hypothetical protein [Paenibacillus sp. LX16]
MQKKATIKATVKLVPHPEPKKLVDLWYRIVLNEIYRRDTKR